VKPSATVQGRALYRIIVERARQLGLAGASVFTVSLYLSEGGAIGDSDSDYTAHEVPVVVEIIDAAERIELLLSELGQRLANIMVTFEDVRALPGPPGEAASAPGARSGGDQEAPRLNPAAQAEEATMTISGDAMKLTIYIGSSDTVGGKNLALAIVELCRSDGIAGATASRGIMGYGGHSRIHRAHFLGLSEDLPERIEVIDLGERIERILPRIRSLIDGGLVILQPVHVRAYRPHEARPEAD
ncbi:MAG: DUF190 domain-containing protein, partial [Isosphaeraceae bacterium]